MKPKKHSRLLVETLENRDCPSAITAVLSGGSLIVKALSATNDLHVVQTDAHTFQVTENGTSVGMGTYHNVTGDVVVNLSNGDDKGVLINLGGNTTPRGLQVDLGNGANDLTIANGIINGNLKILGTQGSDHITFEDAVPSPVIITTPTGATTTTTTTGASTTTTTTGASTTTTTTGASTTTTTPAAFLEVKGNTDINLTGRADGSLVTTGMVKLDGNLNSILLNDVLLDTDTTVGGSVKIQGNAKGNTIELDGTINGNLTYYGSARANEGNTLTIAGTVGGNVNAYTNGLLGFLFGGDDTVTIDGTILGNLYLDTGRGADSVTLDGTVKGRATVLLGEGDNIFEFGGSVGTAGNSNNRLYVSGGSGNDSVTFAASATVFTEAKVYLGAGNDTFTLEDRGNTKISAFVDGGVNGIKGDTFQGNVKQLVRKPVGFEHFV